MGEVLWLGVLLGAGCALSVGPIFVTILSEAAARGFGASLRVILGSATADLVLLLPALAFAWLIAAVARAAFWVGLAGAAIFAWLAVRAVRDAVLLWREDRVTREDDRAFWKGVAGNLANPLTWTFWLATGTPAMMRTERLAGRPGLAAFTVTWFVVASGIEAVLALAVAATGRRVGHRGQGAFTAASALVFAVLAGMMLIRSVRG